MRAIGRAQEPIRYSEFACSSAGCTPPHRAAGPSFEQKMAWILRPFIGAPGSEFTHFRARTSNVFESILQCFERLF